MDVEFIGLGYVAGNLEFRFEGQVGLGVAFPPGKKAQSLWVTRLGPGCTNVDETKWDFVGKEVQVAIWGCTELRLGGTFGPLRQGCEYYQTWNVAGGVSGRIGSPDCAFTGARFDWTPAFKNTLEFGPKGPEAMGKSIWTAADAVVIPLVVSVAVYARIDINVAGEKIVVPVGFSEIRSRRRRTVAYFAVCCEEKIERPC
jgi:hypothetical protein